VRNTLRVLLPPGATIATINHADSLTIECDGVSFHMTPYFDGKRTFLKVEVHKGQSGAASMVIVPHSGNVALLTADEM
jgi:hypothetical protein